MGVCVALDPTTARIESTSRPSRSETTQSTKDRMHRVEKNAQEVRDASGEEDEAIDAMVQKSVRLDGP
jgi:hypothetical protein